MVGEDGTVAVRATMYGTFEGSLNGVPPTGEAVALPTVSLFTMSPDGIALWRDYWDRKTFRRQLGLASRACSGISPAWWTLRRV